MGIKKKTENNRCHLSIVMPAYNEEGQIFDNLMETLRIVESFCDRFELVAVDDGSEDATFSEILRAAAKDSRIAALKNETNMGKGYALKAGTESANGEYIAFLDSDLDLPPAQLGSFIRMMEKEKADVVIGSKLHPDSNVDYPLQRQIVSFIYYSIIRCLFHLNIHDTQTGIKLFKANIIKPVMRAILVKRFAYDIEALVLCKHMGAKIVEHPIELVFQRVSPFGRMKFHDLWYTGMDTLAIFYRFYIKKHYKLDK